MAERRVSIGSLIDIHVFNDVLTDYAVDTDAKMRAEGIPTLGDDVLRLDDVGTLTGDVFGPGASTDHSLARFDGVTGKLLQDSDNVTLDDDGQFTLAANARIKHREWLTANGVRAAGAQAATLAKVGVSIAWQFSIAGDKEIQFVIAFPFDIDRTVDIEMHIGWFTADNNIARVANWEMVYKLTQMNEDFTGALDGTLDVSPNPSAVANGIVSTDMGDITVGANDLCISGNLILDVSDCTIVNDAYLVGLCMEYTANKLGGAV